MDSQVIVEPAVDPQEYVQHTTTTTSTPSLAVAVDEASKQNDIIIVESNKQDEASKHNDIVDENTTYVNASHSTSTTTTSINPPSASVSESASSASPAPSATEDNLQDTVDEKKTKLFSGNVLTKHSRLVVLSLNNQCIMWREKEQCTVMLPMIIGVTTLKKYFTIHYIHTGKKHKTKETYTFKCETEKIAQQWSDAIHDAKSQAGNGTRGLRAVFVINPFSGTKKAVSVFGSVRSLFDIAGMVVTVIETNAAGHAREIGRTIDLNTVDRLVTVSGDGLFNELINGIMDRADWREASKLPLGVIPAGSGNGLAFSLGHANAFEAALAVITGSARPFDILRTIQNGRVMYGFLTLTWAMISDVDIESEKMRWMGSLRFSIGALKRVLSLRKYKGKITYLPADESSQPPAPCVSFQQCAKCSHPIPQEEHPPQDLVSVLYDPTQPPPPGWQVLDDEFVVFIATNVAHISTDFMASPHAHLSDGAIDLVLVRARPELTKPKLISLLLQTENGKYVQSPLVEHYKLKALYLEPERFFHGNEEAGVMAVDGEKVPYAPIGVEVYRGLMKILCYE